MTHPIFYKVSGIRLIRSILIIRNIEIKSVRVPFYSHDRLEIKFQI